MKFLHRMNEIYSEEDFKKGDDFDKDFLEIKFRNDFRRDKLVVKKLIRLKYSIKDQTIKDKVDDILNLLT